MGKPTDSLEPEFNEDFQEWDMATTRMFNFPRGVQNGISVTPCSAPQMKTAGTAPRSSAGYQ